MAFPVDIIDLTAVICVIFPVISINKYKKTEYVAVEYPPTSEIMANIRELEIEISKCFEELEGMLNA